MSQRKTAVITIFLVCLVLFFRKYDAFVNPQFWAEDGILFDNWLQFGAKSFFLQYAGYINLFPRLVAFLASFFPFSFTPAIYNYICLLVVLAICGWLFSSRLRLPYKPLFALAIVLVPHGGESFLNLPSIYWFMSLALVFLAIQEHPVGIWQILLDLFVLILVGLSGPCIVYGLPLFALRCIAAHLSRLPLRRKIYDYLLLAGALVLLGAQFYSLANSPNPTLRGAELCKNFDAWVRVLGNRYAGGLFFGVRLAALMSPWLLAGLTILLPFLLLILLDETPSVALRNIMNNRKSRLYTGTMFLLFAIGIAGCVLYKHRSMEVPILSIQALARIGDAERYFFIGYIMVLWTLILCLESRPFKRGVTAFLLVLSLLASTANFQWPPFTDYHWRDTVLRYGATIPRHPVDEMTSITHIPINPPGCYVESKLAVNVVQDKTYSFRAVNSGGTEVYNQAEHKFDFPLRKNDIIRIQILPARPLESDDRAFIILYDPAQKSGEMIYHDQVIIPQGKRILERDVKESLEAPVLVWRNWKASGSVLPETKIRICVIRPAATGFKSVYDRISRHVF